MTAMGVLKVHISLTGTLDLFNRKHVYTLFRNINSLFSSMQVYELRGMH